MTPTFKLIITIEVINFTHTLSKNVISYYRYNEYASILHHHPLLDAATYIKDLSTTPTKRQILVGSDTKHMVVPKTPI